MFFYAAVMFGGKIEKLLRKQEKVGKKFVKYKRSRTAVWLKKII